MGGCSNIELLNAQPCRSLLVCHSSTSLTAAHLTLPCSKVLALHTSWRSPNRALPLEN